MALKGQMYIICTTTTPHHAHTFTFAHFVIVFLNNIDNWNTSLIFKFLLRYHPNPRHQRPICGWGLTYQNQVGLDVRWRYAFVSQQQFDVTTMRLCVEQRCLIFQVNKAGGYGYVPYMLSNFMNNKNLKIVGLRMEKTLQKLEYDCNLNIAHALDLDILVAKKLSKSGLAELVMELFR